MRRVMLALLLLSAGSAAPARPQESGPDLLGAACRDLEGNDPKRVFAAVQAIAQLGGASLPAIEVRAKEAKGRVRDYLELAAEEIRSAPHLPGYPPVQRVTMKSSDRNVIELLADLRAKTATALSLENLMEEEKLPEIPLDVKDATMLEAFDAICHAGNVKVSMQNGQFALFSGSYVEQPRFFYGHYFLRLSDFELVKSVTFRRPATQFLSLDMEMVWDPTAAPLRFRSPVVAEALDDRGKSLLHPPTTTDPKGKEEGKESIPDEDGPNMKVLLAAPSPAATKIVLVRGFVPIVLPKSRLTASFASPKEDQIGGAGEFQVRVTGVDPAQHKIRLAVRSKKHTPEQLSKLDFLSNVTLKEWDATVSTVDKASWVEDSLDLVVTYEPMRLKDGQQKPGDEAPQPAVDALDLSIVTAVHEKRVPFEFRELKFK